MSDKTMRIGLRMPISLVKRQTLCAEMFPEAHSFVEQSSNFSGRTANDLRRVTSRPLQEGGFFIGLIIGYAIKKVIKLAAVIFGLFIAALAYL